MARWEDTHTIIKNFGFGNPAKQYKKGAKARLSGECATFAEANNCATPLNPSTPIIDDPVIEGADSE